MAESSIARAMFVFTFLFFNWATAEEKRSFQLPSQAQVFIGAAGRDKTDKSSEGCRDFKLNKAQIREIFSTYHEVTPFELHNNYLWAPCYIDGAVQFRGKKFKWRIRVGNTLETAFPDGKWKVLGGAYTDTPSGK